jgi:hypothetical protein
VEQFDQWEETYENGKEIPIGHKSRVVVGISKEGVGVVVCV